MTVKQVPIIKIKGVFEELKNGLVEHLGP